MTTMVEYFSKCSEPYPGWLHDGNFSLRCFFKSRTVFYPGAGAHGRPLDIFNPSHSAHCYFLVDQMYSAARLDQQTGDKPTGYRTIYNHQFSIDELLRECTCPLPTDDLGQFAIPPRAGVSSFGRAYRSQDSSMLAAVDSTSAVYLRVYERVPGYDEAHGAERFAMFCLGMEARTAYEWFYGTMFRDHPPYAVWLQDDGPVLDPARLAAHDRGFGDPNGRLYRAALETGLPEFLVVRRNTRHWSRYRRVRGVGPKPGFLGHHPYKVSRNAVRGCLS